MSMAQATVSLGGLRKSYRVGESSVEALKGVSLAVAAGEMVALTGPSGSGKSTLLNLCGLIDTPDAGSRELCGKVLDGLDEIRLTQLRREKVGFIFQAYHLLPELDALENVCLPARMARADAIKTAARGREMLKRVGLGERMDHKPMELSGGEQQRVAIARALINEPELILADEPTGNLDSHTGAGIMELLCSLREERRVTLVIATHDSSVATRSPKVIQLLDGVITS